jgi:hypothetical protein
VSKRVVSVVGIGCGIVLVLLIAAGVALVVFAPNLLNWANDQIAREQARQQWASDWQPPSDSIDQFFPAKIETFELESRDQDASIQEFQFNIDGHHAVYQSPEDRIEIFVFEANDLEKEALFGRVHDAYEESQGSYKRITDVGYRLYYSSSQHGQNHLWWSKGWLLVFRTLSDSDQERFIESYFQATSDSK